MNAKMIMANSSRDVKALSSLRTENHFRSVPGGGNKTIIS